MAVSRALRRLLSVLKLEEEQAKTALEAAIVTLRRVEQCRAAMRQRERRGRNLVAASVGSGQLEDRLAGLEEARFARRAAEILALRATEAERHAAMLRERFLAKRMERRQAETLVREAEAREAAAADRRAQQSLDEWFLRRGRSRGAGPLGEAARPVEELDQEQSSPA